jgi:hypothetical protein
MITADIDLQTQSTLMFNEQQVPLDREEWSRLAEIMAQSDYQHIIGGDAEESHSVWVSRYYNDVVTPEALSPYSEAVKAIVMSSKMRRFYKRFTGTDKLCLRRCQANRLDPGDYIGVHRDQDSSPDYFATVVFHFDSRYNGGYFETLPDNDTPISVKPRAYTALVNNCSVPHQVTPVNDGSRLTLACFLSTSFGTNTTVPKPFKIKELS